MNTLLKQVKPKRISDQIFEQLQELISRGELRHGEQIMTERELAEAMNVSRTSVRNAISRLVALGFLEHRQGQGTFVRTPSPGGSNPLASAMNIQDATLEDILEVRLGLECNAASLAALRAVDEDIRFLDKSMEEMKSDCKSGGQGTEADVSFHMAIAYATKNQVQVSIMRNFYDLLFYGVKENLFYLYQDSGRIELILEQHEKIADAIRKHDPEKAFSAMKQHIEYVLDFYKNK